jgi:hypothetical protein
LPHLARKLDAAGSEFVLVSRRTLRSNNSWNHNSPRLVSGTSSFSGVPVEVSAIDAGVARAASLA